MVYPRIQMDSSPIVNNPFDISEALMVFKMPQASIFLGIEVCLGAPL